MEGILEEKMESGAGWPAGVQQGAGTKSYKVVVDGTTPSTGLQDAAIPVAHFKWNFNYK